MDGAVPRVGTRSPTTALGIVMLIATGATLVAHAMTVGIGMGDIQAVLNALTGLGLIKAADAK